MKSQQHYKKTFSCEFFPPKTPQGVENLRAARDELAALGPAFFSCTYGAGATTQEGTYETVRDIIDAGHEAVPHITCIGSTKDKIRGLLNDYRALGARRLVALRGDLPEGMTDPGEFKFASDLVAFIRAETGDHFHIEVAAYPEMHPQATDFMSDLQNFRAKVEAGASSAITQYFFNAEAYYRFVEDLEALGVTIAVVPGIMPITNYRQLARFSDGCGAEIPRWIRTRLEGYGDDLDSIRAFGLEVVTRLCDDLLRAGAPGLHFYTLNRSAATLALWRALDLGNH
jgi:methylenetetrahydrofolate reductase (NADPH)